MADVVDIATARAARDERRALIGFTVLVAFVFIVAHA